MKLMEKMRQRKLGNKGFTLVELIIVIAIMAILLGIVGTQVVPYLNRAREAKDLQIINSYCTAAVAAYSMHAEDFAASEASNTNITISMATSYTNPNNQPRKIWYETINELVGNYTFGTDSTLQAAMSSKAGKLVTDVEITLNWSTGEVTARAIPPTDADAKVKASSFYTTTVTSVISSAP